MFYRLTTNEQNELTLVLDLDETVIVLNDAAHFKHVYYTHSLSQPFFVPMDQDLKQFIAPAYWNTCCVPHLVYIINPDEIKELILSAYKNNANIMILTAGLYDKEILGVIATQLNLPESISRKFSNAQFFSPVTELKKGIMKDIHINDLRAMPKAIIIREIRKYFKLKNHHFILLDDNPSHISSCNTFDYITAVWARTFDHGKSFYNEVLDHLENFKFKMSAIKDVRRYEVMSFLMSNHRKLEIFEKSCYLKSPFLFAREKPVRQVMNEVERLLIR